ncbi:MAG: UDP-N-acetylmuramate dehydrogenase [Pseudomonadota bacterium]|nr:UDP-N-acetylmuramate dehydrogenase [Pseudomonadota bacterium]
MTAPALASWIDTLPPPRGTVVRDAPVAAMTWLKVGGPADLLFTPADIDDLTTFLTNVPADVPITIIGAGSNLLVRDGGLDGAVVRLGPVFANIAIDGTRIRAGAGARDSAVAEAAAQNGLAGLEFLTTIPGAIGGAVAMNAGAFGREVKDVLVSATLVTRAGRLFNLDCTGLGLDYRSSVLPDGAVIIEVEIEGVTGSVSAIRARMNEMIEKRSTSQPTCVCTGGSTFRNPEGACAWELIADAGCRGLTCGGAVISDKHCNFIINSGNATALDLETLGETVRKKVKEQSGVTLEWEVRRLGREKVVP